MGDEVDPYVLVTASPADVLPGIPDFVQGVLDDADELGQVVGEVGQGTTFE